MSRVKIGTKWCSDAEEYSVLNECKDAALFNTMQLSSVYNISVKVSGIYKITNILSGKFYIGESVDIFRRCKQHANCFTNSAMSAAIKKYGICNFTVQLIENCSKGKARELEQYYIDKYKGCGFNSYNMAIGGGMKHLYHNSSTEEYNKSEIRRKEKEKVTKSKFTKDKISRISNAVSNSNRERFALKFCNLRKDIIAIITDNTECKYNEYVDICKLHNKQFYSAVIFRRYCYFRNKENVKKIKEFYAICNTKEEEFNCNEGYKKYCSMCKNKPINKAAFYVNITNSFYKIFSYKYFI